MTCTPHVVERILDWWWWYRINLEVRNTREWRRREEMARIRWAHCIHNMRQDDNE